MITDKSLEIIQEIDRILDEYVSDDYKDAALAQDWARISKVIEECGEAISELISYTGQNPRKIRGDSKNLMLGELADTALTAIYAIQHFTKDSVWTNGILQEAISRHLRRLKESIKNDQ